MKSYEKHEKRGYQRYCIPASLSKVKSLAMLCKDTKLECPASQ